jgi:hypothetical protein
MYSTCLFCHTTLGANEAVEHFPVGRRLAFDGAKGRLWVVCRKCERWNLTPIEERWEAIEECERSFRDTKLRVSTEQIGLARLGEGTELVRIGSPLRPEFAAWRYGDQFGKRRRRQMVTVGAAVAGVALAVPLGMIAGASLGIGGWNLYHIARFGTSFVGQNQIVARFTGPDGRLAIVRRHHVPMAMLLRGDRDYPWGLRLEHDTGKDKTKKWWQYDAKTAFTVVHGDDALRLAGQILPGMNYRGASKQQLKESVALVEHHRDPSAFFRAAARTADRPGQDAQSERGTLSQLGSEFLLAMEMVSHEESERRAMEGELWLLEDAWKEAEEIAGISDDMFLPEDISNRLSDMKKGR